MGRTGNDPASPSTLACGRRRYRGRSHRGRGFRSHESKAGGSPAGRVRSTAGCSGASGRPSAAPISAARAGTPAAGARSTTAAVRAAAGRSTGPAKELAPAQAPGTGPLNPWGRFLYAVIGRGRSSSSQGDAVGLAPAAAPEGEDDGVGDGLGLEPGLGLGFVSGRATVSACLRGQALFQHNASVWSPTVVSAGIAAATLKPPLWSAVKVASSSLRLRSSTWPAWW